MDSPSYQGFDAENYMYDGFSADIKPDYDAESEYSSQSYSGSSSPRYTELGNAEGDSMMMAPNPITGHDILFNNQVDMHAWRSKPVEQWDNMDVIMWVQDYGTRKQFHRISPEQFADLNGAALLSMGIEAFQARDPDQGTDYFIGINELKYRTDQYYRTCVGAPAQPQQASTITVNNNDQGLSVEKLTSIENYINNYNISFNPDEKFNSLILPPIDSLRPTTERVPQPAIRDQVVPILEEFTPPSSPACSEASSEASVRPQNGRRGRSKGKLWEFVLNLLKDNKHNPSIIKWEDRENGVFRIVRSDQVARLWGVRKQNPSMTYEKMSRAMRYYYKKNILERIDGRRLVYKFGATSKGWQQ